MNIHTCVDILLGLAVLSISVRQYRQSRKLDSTRNNYCDLLRAYSKLVISTNVLKEEFTNFKKK